jgi:hypothetical protein
MYCNHAKYTEGCEWCKEFRVIGYVMDKSNPVQDIIDQIEPIYEQGGLSGVARWIYQRNGV